MLGANTRRYHGLLVVATQPPAGRTVLLAWLDDEITFDGPNGAGNGAVYRLSTAEWSDGLGPRKERVPLLSHS